MYIHPIVQMRCVCYCD